MLLQKLVSWKLKNRYHIIVVWGTQLIPQAEDGGRAMQRVIKSAALHTEGLWFCTLKVVVRVEEGWHLDQEINSVRLLLTYSNWRKTSVREWLLHVISRDHDKIKTESIHMFGDSRIVLYVVQIHPLALNPVIPANLASFLGGVWYEVFLPLNFL